MGKGIVEVKLTNRGSLVADHRKRSKAKAGYLIVLALLGMVLSAEAAGAASAGWRECAPFNTSPCWVGLSFLGDYGGLARAYAALAGLVNFVVLAALVYGFSRAQAEFIYFSYVAVFGFHMFSFILYAVLRPYLGLYALAPVIVFEAYLLARFCLVSLKPALLVALLYHVYQVGYIVVVRAIVAKYS